MGIGIDADTEYARRGSIPSGGAGTLSGGGFSDEFVGVWVYRPSATATYALTAGGAIIHFQAGAREVQLGFNSAGSNLSDLNLQIIFNSGGGAGTPAIFSGHTGASFLDEWVYYFIYEDSSNNQVAGYIRLADLATAVTQSRANDNAGSQYINTLTFGNNSSANACVLGYYAYARAVNSSSLTASNALTYAASAVTESGDWGFWDLDTDTDTADTSGNSRTLTFSSGLTTEASPNLNTGITAAAADTNTPTDSAASETQRVATAADTATPTDSAVSATNRVSTASDTVTPTDSAVAGASLPAAASDTNTPSDSAVAASSLVSAAADTNTPTDSAAAVSSLVAAATDTATPADSAVSATQRIAASVDTLTPSDSAASSTDRIAAASDTLTSTDSAVATKTAAGAAVASDTLTPTDSAVAASSL